MVMASVGVIYAEGETMREAKAALQVKVQSALEGGYSPRIFSYRGVEYLIYREPTGWHGALLRAPGDPTLEPDVRLRTIYCAAFTDQESPAAVERLVAAHAAELVFDVNQNDNRVALDLYLTDAQTDTYKRWCDFQRRYMRATQAGFSPDEARRWAGDDPSMSQSVRQHMTGVICKAA